MNSEHFSKLLNNCFFIECLEDTLVMKQKKNRSGVCIIPEKQDEAARNVLELMGRKLEGICGSKRGNLEYQFSPPLTQEELEKFFY